MNNCDHRDPLPGMSIPKFLDRSREWKQVQTDVGVEYKKNTAFPILEERMTYKLSEEDGQIIELWWGMRSSSTFLRIGFFPEEMKDSKDINLVPSRVYLNGISLTPRKGIVIGFPCGDPLSQIAIDVRDKYTEADLVEQMKSKEKGPVFWNVNNPLDSNHYNVGLTNKFRY
jgi:hypothetical protein